MNNYYKEKAKLKILSEKRKEQRLARKYNKIIKEIFDGRRKESNKNN